MTRDRTLEATVTGKVADMKNWRYIALHTSAAAVFIFALQRYALNASLETSLMWALMLGGCAAGLAYMQSNR
jgi:Na+-transporting NADH:ubiquinone oxidoreductase subunit NqrB